MSGKLELRKHEYGPCCGSNMRLRRIEHWQGDAEKHLHRCDVCNREQWFKAYATKFIECAPPKRVKK